jgi:glycosyltransferase involved in cell wall biosynthesis
MKKRKKIAIIGTAGVPARYGGFETLAHHLVLNLRDEYDIHVYASKKVYPKAERRKRWKGARVHYLPLSANGLSSILYDFLSMLHAIFFADTIVLLGVSAGIFVPFIRLIGRAKIIVNIDGMEWRRDKWPKMVRRFLRWSERVAVRFSHADITDNMAIKRYTARYYKTASHMIAYGADHAMAEDLTNADYQKYPMTKMPYAFKVARIEPENNIELILKTFANYPQKKLIMVGNWDSSQFGKDMRSRYGEYPNLSLLDPIFDQVELNKLRSNCYVYVHGHSAGGTNPSLVEAMFLGLPILSFDVSYNRETTLNKALYFKDQAELHDLLKETSYSELMKVSTAMKCIARDRYTWKYISRRYASIIDGFDYQYEKRRIVSKVATNSYRELLDYGYAHLQDSKKFYQD